MFCSSTLKFCQKGQPARGERKSRRNGRYRETERQSEQGVTLIPDWVRKKVTHCETCTHTHNTHIWSIQFLLPISEDKYDGCKLHTVKLVFYTVYMRWVSTLVNYSADYSEVPFINEGCGCLVGLIHESSPPSRVISRLCGCSTFFSANMWGRLWHFHFEFIITLLKITSVNFPWQIFFKWHRQGPLKKKKKMARTLAEQHAEGCLAPLCLLPCMQATTCRISSPEHPF